jgi:predicted transcriptional regulator
MEAKDFVTDLLKWGLTQVQIAERSGIPQPTISKIARGEVEDVLSRNYRSLQHVHEAEKKRRARRLAPPGADRPNAHQKAGKSRG